MKFNKLSEKNRRWLKLQIILLSILVVIYILLLAINSTVYSKPMETAEATPIADGIHPPVVESSTSDLYTDRTSSYVELNLYRIGHTTAHVNVRQQPTTDSTIVYKYPAGICIEYKESNTEGWYQTRYEGDIVYIYSEYIEEGMVPYRSISISSEGFKSFMDYRAITSKSSVQYQIQNNYAYTGKHGIRQVNGRYCIALGTAVNEDLGTYVDLFLANGTVINCILVERKDDIDTMEDNLTSTYNGCVSEFITDRDYMDDTIKHIGDCSYMESAWQSPVVEIRVYEMTMWD